MQLCVVQRCLLLTSQQMSQSSTQTAGVGTILEYVRQTAQTVPFCGLRAGPTDMIVVADSWSNNL
jgi:hypothetical protein